MKLLVGLGNIGKEYEGTRHNMGFDVVSAFAERAKIDLDRHGYKATYGKGKIFDEDIIIAMPDTFMNNSGQSVVELVNFFKIDKSEIIVVFDDMALNPGNIRLRENGSSGGQKGMQSIIDLLGTQDIKRIRVGIGEPPSHQAIDWVLGKPSIEDRVKINNAIEKACNALVDCYKKDFHHSMSIYNKTEEAKDK